MMRYLRAALTALICTVVLSTPTRAGDLETARDALAAKKYATAYRILNPMAARGDRDAMRLMMGIPRGSFRLTPSKRETAAVAALERSDTAENRSKLAWIRRDRALAHAKRFDEIKDPLHLDAALTYAQSMVELAPNEAEMWVVFALIHMRNMREAESRRLAQAAFERVGDTFRNTLPMLATLQMMNSEYRKAALTFRRIVELRPQMLEQLDLQEMNFAFIKAGFQDLGLDLYDSHLRFRPSAGEVRVSKAILLRSVLRDAEAVRELQRVIDDGRASQTARTVARNLQKYWGDG